MVQPVPEHIDFAKEEEITLKLWKDLDAFQTSLKQSKSRPRYTFYDGPPFATGLPHYGHILAGTVKDVITRWAHQSGFHVERRFGWDCHGLPVEYEIDKLLGIKGPEDVEKMGIDKYNAECRKIVMRYAREWEEIVTRLGRWIDFKNDYKTMYPSFMESIWWVFKQLFDKGLVYRGFKVMPFSTACNTPLSNFESGQNYKEVQDPSVIVSFPLDESPDISVLAWTTTPWTLPSNLALCMHPDNTYVKIKEKATGHTYILMEARLVSLYKAPDEYEVLERFKGSAMEGKTYKPLFSYFLHMKERGAFRILTDAYVTDESGTGVVHQAPYFGEDDYRISLKYNIITKDMSPICPLDMSGRFIDPVIDFKGQHVKDADKNIIKWLKEHGRLVNQATVTHSYPFCWRSDTPLIYRAVPSWFVRVEFMTDKLLASNAQSYWVPEFVKEKRFGNWLRDARDWAISRNRYWGTPIPLWVSEDGQEIVCIGSVDELKKMTGNNDISDLHRESIDHLTIPSVMKPGTVLRRAPEVFDCWFESGSMPYAQNHYPFENRKEFEDGFPGDFVAEGIDQTRGWFYTLVVLSTALYGKTPFKNLICHGLVLAADGQKMSKRKKNYPDPMDIVHKYGADAIRLYLINSPVVRADNLRFKEEGVRDILKDVFLPWYNAYRFLMQNVERLEREEGEKFLFDEGNVELAENYMDRWIVSFTQSLVMFVRQEMQAYRLYTVVPRLVKFVDHLTNWYVRMNRRRLKGEKTGLTDCYQALRSLFSVLFAMTKVMAPFVPFVTEHIYQNLRHLIDPKTTEGEDTKSIHYLMLPRVHESLIDTTIETAVSRMQTVVELGRVIRDRRTLPMKYPLKEVVVIHKDPSVLQDVTSLQNYIKEELNVRTVTVTSDKCKYGVMLRAEPDHKVLGLRLKGAFKTILAAIKDLTDDQLVAFQQTGQIEVAGHQLSTEDLRLIYVFDKTSDDTPNQYEAHSDNNILVLLDVSPEESMFDEGLAREVMNRVQRLRKKAKLMPSDDITIFYKTGGTLTNVIVEFRDFIFATIKQPMVPFTVSPPSGSGINVIATDTTKIKDDDLELVLVQGHVADSAALSQPDTTVTKNGPGPACRFVNIELLNGGTDSQATVLLENPRGKYIITLPDLVKQVKIIFGINSRSVRLYRSRDKKQELTELSGNSVLNLHATMLFADIVH